MSIGSGRSRLEFGAVQVGSFVMVLLCCERDGG